MIIHNFDPILIDLGFFQIRWYSLAYIVGIISGWIYANKIINKTLKKNNILLIEPKIFDDLVIYLILGIIIGGRLGYVLFYNLEYYFQNFKEILMLWNGGMSFHGGLFGVVIAVFLFSKKKNISFLSTTDIISCVAPIGIFLGRLANFINGELFGKISTVPWAIIFPQAGAFARHPSQLYEAILEGLLLFAIINFISLKKNKIIRTGLTSCYFLIFYSIFRIFSEYFRVPDEHIGYFLNFFTMGSLLSFLTLIIGLVMLIKIKRNE